MSNNRQIMSENCEKSLEDVYRNLFQNQEWKKIQAVLFWAMAQIEKNNNWIQVMGIIKSKYYKSVVDLIFSLQCKPI